MTMIGSTTVAMSVVLLQHMSAPFITKSAFPARTSFVSPLTDTAVHVVLIELAVRSFASQQLSVTESITKFTRTYLFVIVFVLVVILLVIVLLVVILLMIVFFVIILLVLVMVIVMVIKFDAVSIFVKLERLAVTFDVFGTLADLFTLI